jgi:hypothetical protein
MDNKVEIEGYIYNEFSCYYPGDELPGKWTESFIENEIPEMVADSARRLITCIDKSQIEDMISVLAELRRNQKHPLVEKIVYGSLMGWYDSEENWRVFQLIIDGIISNLRNQG